MSEREKKYLAEIDENVERVDAPLNEWGDTLEKILIIQEMKEEEKAEAIVQRIAKVREQIKSVENGVLKELRRDIGRVNKACVSSKQSLMKRGFYKDSGGEQLICT
jgi:hypothetical protein